MPNPASSPGLSGAKPLPPLQEQVEATLEQVPMGHPESSDVKASSRYSEKKPVQPPQSTGSTLSTDLNRHAVEVAVGAEETPPLLQEEEAVLKLSL